MKFQIMSLLIIASLFVACSNDEVSDEPFGIRKAPLEDESKVDLKAYEFSSSAPGESQRIERSYENAPPLIPHDIEGMEEITQESNTCLSCHSADVAESVGATPVPKSHMYDYRAHKPMKDSIVKSRYNCTQCHVPQAKTPPVVKNFFKPEFSSPEEKFHSDLFDVINKGVK